MSRPITKIQFKNYDSGATREHLSNTPKKTVKSSVIPNLDPAHTSAFITNHPLLGAYTTVFYPVPIRTPDPRVRILQIRRCRCQ